MEVVRALECHKFGVFQAVEVTSCSKNHELRKKKPRRQLLKLKLNNGGRRKKPKLRWARWAQPGQRLQGDQWMQLMSEAKKAAAAAAYQADLQRRAREAAERREKAGTDGHGALRIALETGDEVYTACYCIFYIMLMQHPDFFEFQDYILNIFEPFLALVCTVVAFAGCFSSHCRGPRGIIPSQAVCLDQPG